MKKKTPARNKTKKRAKIAHPGMMGDGTEEQNLGERGNPAARIEKGSGRGLRQTTPQKIVRAGHQQNSRRVFARIEHCLARIHRLRGTDYAADFTGTWVGSMASCGSGLLSSA